MLVHKLVMTKLCYRSVYGNYFGVYWTYIVLVSIVLLSVVLLTPSQNIMLIPVMIHYCNVFIIIVLNLLNPFAPAVV